MRALQGGGPERLLHKRHDEKPLGCRPQPPKQGGLPAEGIPCPNYAVCDPGTGLRPASELDNTQRLPRDPFAEGNFFLNCTRLPGVHHTSRCVQCKRFSLEHIVGTLVTLYSFFQPDAVPALADTRSLLFGCIPRLI